MSATALARIGIALALVYASVLAVNGPARSPEIFPFFNWSLFSDVPDPETTDYGLRITAVGGEELPEPVYFEQADSLLRGTGSPDAYQAIQRLGRALDGDRILQIATTRDLIEARFIGGLGSADYEIVRRRFDIVDRHRCDCFSDEDVIERLTLTP